MERACGVLERRRRQRAYLRHLIADALARAVQHRDRALARGYPRVVARYEAVILRAEQALAVLDAASAAEKPQP